MTRTAAQISGFLTVLLWCAIASGQQVYWEVGPLLGDFFPNAARVTYDEVELTGAETTALQQRLGTAVERTTWTIFRALDADGAAVGYAIFDEELGEHRPITFAVQFDRSGRVVRQEVVVYRESHGEGIVSARFREQFSGRGPGDGMRDIVAVSGATISSNSMRRGVQRTIELVNVLLETRPALLGVEQLSMQSTP